MTSPVYFLGAGPGDPELITLKGRRLLDEADVIVYAGSLVNPVLLDGVKADVHDSAGMDLDAIMGVMISAAKAGKKVVRLHTGDPAIYGAIREQMQLLDREDIAYEVVPGVSSALASAAALKAELTVPEVTQTVIFTRQAGRTPVPERESLHNLPR
jgi:precorrin-4/cobalt-precorrin-4 C11-methyltransferase